MSRNDPATRQELHLGIIDQHDAAAHAAEWLADDDSLDVEETPWGMDPLAALEQKEQREGINTFDQPIY